MTEKLMFEVHVERATPACAENCPNLQIVSNHGEAWCGGIKINSSKYECKNANYCAGLYRTMKKMMEEKNASR